MVFVFCSVKVNGSTIDSPNNNLQANGSPNVYVGTMALLGTTTVSSAATFTVSCSGGMVLIDQLHLGAFKVGALS